MALSVSSAPIELHAQSGVAFSLQCSESVRIIATHAEQVADLAIFNAADTMDAFSAGRTIDYNESIRLSEGDVLYSQRSTPLARIMQAGAGVHDMLLSPCSRVMFERRGEYNHPSCHANLSTNLARFGISSDSIVSTINVFMDVRVGVDGEVRIYPPRVQPGDCFTIQALCNIVVGLAACSSERTNNGRCKPLSYTVLRP